MKTALYIVIDSTPKNLGNIWNEPKIVVILQP